MAVCLENWIALFYLVILCGVIFWIYCSKTTDVSEKKPQTIIVESPSKPQRPVPINIPTQGFYGPFVQVGYLQPVGERHKPEEEGCSSKRGGCKNCHKCRKREELEEHVVEEEVDYLPQLRLYGRRVDSNRYEYYTTNHLDPEIKIDLYVPRDQELYNGDPVRVPGYGKYQSVIYQQMYPTYI